ncbi:MULTISPECIES: hypothetical protein [Pseudomonas]|jgi:hypothetical protein|uniref:Uncharacterized protein n=1 Tax=Pseudomonas marincola TaxID=437900 RepID=A0A1I6YWI9_9PSED|nr:MULTISPECIES: hypothetical protein [Pseudomonas]MBQ53372.1 hypothetical protein [Pseudomonadaceae bacterium]CAE6937859.1 conserved protein of unknown function [Pseudomonas marincola]SFT54832.1 hypothetical protein SAMN05216264_101887 [Pseudomonas marincola]
MNIAIRTEKKPESSCWQVFVDQQAIPFRSEAEARQFVTTLEARVRAPHWLPEQKIAG